MEFLGRPQVQLGLFWRDPPEHVHFDRVLDWLVRRGYRPTGDVLAIEAQNGRLPRFSICDHPGEPASCTTEIASAEFMSGRASAAWLPVRVLLNTQAEYPPKVVLEYTQILEPAFSVGEPHAVQICAAATALTLVHVTPKDEIDDELAREAAALTAWCDEIFFGLVRDLSPDYAAITGEVDLQPPSALTDGAFEAMCSEFYIGPRYAAENTLTLPPRFRDFSASQFGSGRILRQVSGGGSD